MLTFWLFLTWHCHIVTSSRFIFHTHIYTQMFWRRGIHAYADKYMPEAFIGFPQLFLLCWWRLWGLIHLAKVTWLIKIARVRTDSSFSQSNHTTTFCSYFQRKHQKKPLNSLLWVRSLLHHEMHTSGSTDLKFSKLPKLEEWEMPTFCGFYYDCIYSALEKS